MSAGHWPRCRPACGAWNSGGTHAAAEGPFGAGRIDGTRPDDPLRRCMSVYHRANSIRRDDGADIRQRGRTPRRRGHDRASLAVRLRSCLAEGGRLMYGGSARIGRINPSPETVGDEEWRRLMPEGVIVVSTRMYIESVDASGLTNMVTHVDRAARELATTRPNVILMAGTAGAFNGGLNFDVELSRRIELASGVVGTTTMSAVLAALNAMKIRRLCIATSYIESVDQALAAVLVASGIDVVAVKGMGILKSIDM